MTPWEITAREFTNCNCAYGCPCQFNAPPTHGHCMAVAGFAIENGHFGDIRLDGLKAAGVLQWPGAIHEGHGKALMIIDERADEAQRKALLTILSGQETAPGATIWNVFASTMEHVYDPVFAPIDIEIDIEKRKGRLQVNGFIDVTGEPIRNPVTGQEHRVRIDIPDGFEYRIAEMGSASSKVRGPIAFELNDTYAQFANLHLNQNGVVG